MSNAEQVALGTTLAGVNQYKVFSAVMGNFDTAIKVATDDVNYFNGSALRQNEKYMESIKAKVQALKAELQKLIFENNVLQNAFKSLLNVLTDVVKFFNTAYGKFVLVATVLTLLGNTIITKVVPMLKMLPMVLYQAFTSFQMFTSGIMTAKEAMDAFTLSLNIASLNPYTIALTAILVVVTAAAVGIYKLSKLTETYSEKLKKQKEIVEETTKNLKEYREKLDDINEKIEKIKQAGSDIDENSEEILNKLRLEREELEEIVRLEEIRQEGAKKEATKQAEKIFKAHPVQNDFEGSNIASKYERTMITRLKQGIRKKEDELLVAEGYLSEDTYQKLVKNASEGELDFADSLTLVTAKLKKYGDEFTELSKKKEAAKDKNSGVHWSVQDEEELDKVKKQLDVATLSANDLATKLKDTMDSSDSTAKGFSKAQGAYKGYQEVIKEASDETKNYIGVSDDVIDTQEEEVESVEDLADAWKYSDKEKLKAQEFLEETGIKEKDLSQQIGMSSLELARQAEQWRTNAESLYHYLKALKELDEELDNAQSSYNTLKSAVDEYNEYGGFSVDTLQELLKLSPEYLQAIFDENGELRLQNGILELNEKAIKDKVTMMAAEAKQAIYNNATERILNLTKDETTAKNISNQESYDDSTDSIKRNSDALVENARAELANAIAKSGARGGSVKDSYVNQILKETEEQLKLVDNMVEGLGKDFSATMSSASQKTKEANQAIKEQNQLLKKQKEELKEKKKQYDDVVGYIKKKIQDEIKALEKEKKAQVDAIKDQIDAVKDLKKEELDSIQEQIDKLKEKQDEEEEYWQKKIDALKEQNEEINTQLEYEKLLQDLAKAKAKRVRVYEEGKGFVYKEDTNEIDKAQSKLDEFNRKQSYEKQLKQLEEYKKKSKENYDKQIKDLEKLKDEKEKNYDKQIKDLEDYQKKVEDDYDSRIKYFQDYLDKFTKETDAYENEVNRQLAIQLTGIDFEKEGWQTRLDNLADFVEKYNKLLGDIHTLDSIPDDDSTTEEEKKEKKEKEEKEEEKKESKKSKAGMPSNVPNNNDRRNKTSKDDNKEKKVSDGKKIKNVPDRLKKASGDSYISEDGVYLVGDSPNQELVIGSRINGSLMNLTQGSGVVNSTSTRTLAGILNQLGVMGNQGVNMSNSHNNSTNISIGNISLPSVQNGKEFVDYLQNFSLQMTQEAFV